MSRLYGPAHRALQDQFDTRELADRIEDVAARILLETDTVAQHHRGAGLPAVTGADHVLRMGLDLAAVLELEVPRAPLHLAAVVGERFFHHPAIAVPRHVEIANETRRDATERTVDHPLAQDRPGQMRAQVELGLHVRVILRTLRGEGGHPVAQEHEAQDDRECDGQAGHDRHVSPPRRGLRPGPRGPRVSEGRAVPHTSGTRPGAPPARSPRPARTRPD